MAKYLVYLEKEGDPVTPAGVLAHVPSLPGASVRAKTVEEAKEKIRRVVEAYLRLLREVGEAVPRVSEGLHFEFQEIETSTFPTDYDALWTNEMETQLRWLAVSRQELLGLVKELSAAELDWRPDDNSSSVREILYRMAEADIWYTDRLEKWPEAVLHRLAAARGVALERLRALTETKRTDAITYDGQEWTPRKVMRRILEHERESIEQIKEMLAAQKSD